MWGKILSAAKKLKAGKDLKEADNPSNNQTSNFVANIFKGKNKTYGILVAIIASLIGILCILVIAIITHNFSPYSASDQTNTEEKEDWENFFEEIGELNTSEEFCTGNLCTSYDEKQIYEKQNSIYIRYKDIYKVEITFPFIVGTALYNEDTDEYYPNLTEDCMGDLDKCEDEQFTNLDRAKVRQTVIEQGYGAYVSHVNEYISTNAPYEADQKLGHWAWDNFYDNEPDENSAVLRFNFDYEAKDLARLAKWNTKKETVNVCSIKVCYVSGGCETETPFSNLYEDEENYSVADVHAYFGDLQNCDEMAKEIEKDPDVSSATPSISSIDSYELDKQKFDNYLYNKYLRDKYFKAFNEENEDRVDTLTENMMYDIYAQFDYYLYLMYGEEGPDFEVEKWEEEEECTICNGIYDYGYDPDDDREYVTNDAMVCEYIIDGEQLENLQVQILDCDTLEPTGDLIDFEKYVLGVSYGELGTHKLYEQGFIPEEGLKTHAIAARSFALARAKERGNIKQVDGQWVLSIKSCTDDQVYCDPDLGCHTSGDKSELSPGRGADGEYYKGPLELDWFREAVASTAGQVLLDNNGGIVTGYYASNKVSGIIWHEDGTYSLGDVANSWFGLADSGLDYNEILMKSYAEDGLDSIGQYDCTPVTGDWANWKQFQGPWADQPINKECKDTTIAGAGCALTSVAIQMARSGATLKPEFIRKYGSLDPGTFAAALADGGGFSCIDIYWGQTTLVSSNFTYSDAESKRFEVGKTGSEAAREVASLIDQGYYLVVGVKERGHYVAVEKVVGNDIYVYDPGKSTNGILSELYPNDNGAIYQISAYKKTG